MNASLGPQQFVRVAQFGRKHRVGLLTLVFTDIVGSSQLKQRFGDARAVELIQQHHAAVRELLRQFAEAEEIETAGDSFLLVFARPSEAVKYSLRLRARLERLAGETGVPVLDRIGIHLGEVFIEEQEASTKLFGGQVDACARVMSLAQADQILMTRAVFDNARAALRGQDLDAAEPPTWLSHGPYAFKGIDEPVEVCEVRVPGRGPATPPSGSDKARRLGGAGDLVLGWRPAAGQHVPNTKWVLEEKLGEGGFGEVWKARHEKFPELRVFKFCFRADRVRSLKREVTLFRLLKERIGEHPNLVRVHDIYLDEPPYYLEEEYVAGKDLRTWAEAVGGADKLPMDLKLELIAQAAEGLQAAHDAGVIHRDVKPGNILIAECGTRVAERPGLKPEGREPREVQGPGSDSFGAQPPTPNAPLAAKLTDFGIGQVLSEESLAGMTRAGFTMTMMSSAGSQSGTQLYMAPELLAGKAASTRSDIYSLGVVLYQFLVGDWARPVTTDWAKDVAEPQLREDLARCFAGDPHDRWAAPGQLAANLRALPARRTAAARREAERAALERAAYRRGVVRTAGLASVAIALVTGLAIFSLNASKEARLQRDRAHAQAEQFRRRVYRLQLLGARSSIEQNNGGAAQRYLDESEKALRGWEWHRLRYLADQSSATFQLFTNAVQSAQFSPDRRQVLAVSARGAVAICDANTGAVVWKLPGAMADSAATFSPDGSRLARINGNRIEIWDVPHRRRIEALTGVRNLPASLSFTKSGKKLLVASRKGGVEIWDLVSRRLAWTSPNGAGYDLACFSPDEQRVAALRSDVSLFDVWHVGSGQEAYQIPLPGGFASVVAFSPDGRRLAAGNAKAIIWVYDAATGARLREIPSQFGQVVDLAFSPDGKTLLGLGRTALKMWDAEAYGEIASFLGHASPARCLSVSEDNQFLVSGDEGGAVKTWSTAAGRPVFTLRGHHAELREIAFRPDGKRLVSAGFDGLKVWDTATGQELMDLKGHSGAVVAAAFSPDGRRIASGAFPDGTVQIWDSSSGRLLQTLPGQSNGVFWVTYSPDGRWLASAGPDKTARIWDAETGRQIRVLGPNGHGLEGVAFSPTGKLVATLEENGVAKLWDRASGTLVRTLVGPPVSARSLTFSPDGQSVAVGSDPNGVIWNIRSGASRILPGGAAGRCLELAFSPDGRRVLGGSEGGLISVWDARTGEPLLNFDAKEGAVWSLKISPDGKTVASSGSSGLIQLWETEAPSEEVARKRLVVARAEAVVDQVFQTNLSAAEVLRRLRAGPALEPAVRRVAIQIARARGGDPAQLSSVGGKSSRPRATMALTK